MKEITKYCYFCDEHINKKIFVEHQAKHADENHMVRFSNDMRDAVKSKCKICGMIVRVTAMRGHTKGAHEMVISEYKKKFNQHFYDLVEKILHACGLCGEILLVDSDCIAVHIKCHGITHRDYNARFMKLAAPNNNKKVKDMSDKNAKQPSTQIISDSCIVIDQPPMNAGFQNFLNKLSLPKYPALEAMLLMENMEKQTMLDTAFQVC